MIKCPYCYTKNDDGIRFCNLCKSDITNAEPASESIVDVELVIDGPTATERAVSKSNLNLPESIANAQVENSYLSPSHLAPPTKSDITTVNNDIKLIVVRGHKKEIEYRLISGRNLIGRTDTKPVDINLDLQEDPNKVWVSRQHAVIYVAESISIEDLNSSNGTYVNRERIFPGQKKIIKPGDMIQIGSVLLKLQ